MYICVLLEIWSELETQYYACFVSFSVWMNFSCREYGYCIIVFIGFCVAILKFLYRLFYITIDDKVNLLFKNGIKPPGCSKEFNCNYHLALRLQGPIKYGINNDVMLKNKYLLCTQYMHLVCCQFYWSSSHYRN